MAKDTRAAFLRALAEVEPAIARAFEEAVQDIRSTAQASVIDDVIRRFAAGEIGIEQAVQQLEVTIQLGRQFWAPLDQAMVNAFIQGGTYQAGLAPKRLPNGKQIVVRFDSRNPRADEWMQQSSARLITEIAEDQRTVIRETLTEGVEGNRTYRRITRDLIGTTQGNQRKGGVIGLHSRQAEAVRAARRELEAGDYGAYLGRSGSTRDRRFDRTILKAQREGKPLTAEQIETITGRYSDGLLQHRGRLIARTEANKVANQGRVEAVNQMIESGQIRADLVTKVWNATIGQFTRDSHLALNGQEVAWGGKFLSPVTGALLDHPHDEDAAPAEVVNCRCTMATRMDWAGMA